MNELFSEYFETRRFVPLTVIDLTPVGEDVMDYFLVKEFEVTGTRIAGDGWHISVRRGDWFRAILGLKTALNIRIEPQPGGTLITAGIGIFDLQIIPTVVTIFVFAPVIFTQIWGVLQQNKLDEEAVQFVEDRLVYYGGTAAPEHTAEYAADPARMAAEEELGYATRPASERL